MEFLVHVLLTFCIWSSAAFKLINGDMVGPLGNNYKESCSESERCNPYKYLECQNGMCECISPNEIVFHEETDQCAALAGFSCLREIPGDKAINGKVPKYQISCVSNAKCLYPEDICECEFRYFKGENGTCIRQKDYGDRCGADEECDKYRFLSCISGACSCDANHRYDKKNGKCTVPVGSQCKVIDFKSISEEHYKDDECPEDGYCKLTDADMKEKGVCECNPGFKLSSDKTCGRDYGDPCGPVAKCSDVQFVCRSGTCQCKYPMHQYFDSDTHSCISLAGGPCDSANSGSDSMTRCTENALCQEANPFNFCRCEPGFIETHDGKCLKAHGSSCELDEECDPLPPLACVDNICTCPDKLQVFDEKQRYCVSLAGGRCRKEANQTSPVCTPNGYCVKSNAQLQYGRCICARGTTTTSTRLCSKGQ